MNALFNYVLMLFILTTTLFAIDKSGVVVYNETFVSNDTYTSSNFKGEIKDSTNNFQSILRVKYYNFITNDLFFGTMVSGKYSNIDHAYKKLVNSKSVDNEIYFESLYLTYNLYKNLYITCGVIPFTNGSYSEISELDYSKGTGLIKIIDTPLEAIFLMEKGKLFGAKTIFRLGYGKYGYSGVPITSNVDNDNAGTDGYYITYELFKNYSSLKFNYYHVDLKDDNIPISDVDMYSIGLNKYFTSYGVNIFGTFGYVDNVISLKKSEIRNSVPTIYTYLFPNAFNFEDNKRTSGQLYNIGISKDIDSIFIESYNIGVSYTYTTDNWYSLTNNSYTDEMNFRFMNGDNTYMWATARFTRNIALKAFYGVAENRNARVIGNSSLVVDFKDTPRPFLKRLDRYGLKLVIKY